MSFFVVTGASGLVGRALVASLERGGARVVRMVRHAPSDPHREAYWNPVAGKIDAAALEGAEAVVHLAGKGVADERWTGRVKREVVASRVEGTRLVASAIAGLAVKPRVLVSASAIGLYGDRGDAPLDEDSPPGTGFLAETCQQWEAACRPAWEASVRVVQVRIGIVLSRDGGALAKMLPLFCAGLGGVVGDGRQVMSWIGLADLVRAIRHAVDCPALHGAVNATAPHAVTNREFTRTLGKVLGRPTVLPAPAFALRLVLGEMAGPLLLQGARVVPKRLLESGFTFEAPELAGALRRALG